MATYDRVISGTGQSDTLTGDGRADDIIGRGGNDVLSGLGGADRLRGGGGDDFLDGGAGNDRLQGGNGNDTILAGDGDDRIFGGRGDDVLILSGAFADYSFEQTGTTKVRIIGPDGTDIVKDVESFQFADRTLSFEALFTTPTGPDLVAATPVVSDTVWDLAERIEIDWAITNQGDEASSATTNARVILSTDTTLDDGDLTLLSDRFVNTLGIGETRGGALPYTIPASLAPGTYYVAVLADPQGTVVEGQEDNNLSDWVEVTVTDLRANLAITEFSIQETTLVRDERIRGQVTVVNDGDLPSFPDGVDLIISTDMVFDADDISLHTGVGISLDAGESQTRQPTALLPDLDPGTYFVAAIIDQDDRTIESDETDNLSAWQQITVLEATPDARVSAVNAIGLPDTLIAGETATVTVVFNTGNTGRGGLAEDFTYDVVLARDGIIDDETIVIGSGVLPDIVPGGSGGAALSNVAIPGTLAPGDWRVGVIADPGDLVAEANEDDNVAFGSRLTVLASGVDLAASAVSVSGDTAVVAGASGLLSIGATLSNVGSVDADGPVTVTVVLSVGGLIDTSDRVLRSITIDPIAAGDSIEASFTDIIVPTDLAVGSYRLGVIIDPADAVVEANENNNASGGVTNLTVQAPPPPPPPTGAIRGTEGDDVITGTMIDEEIEAFGGDDIVFVSLGEDTVDGGEGVDTLDFSDVDGRNEIFVTETAVLHVGQTTSSIAPDNPDFRPPVYYSTTATGIERVVLGNTGDDIMGDGGTWTVVGGDGGDLIVLAGGVIGSDGAVAGGDDIIDGGAGDDQIAGGGGDDTITLGEGFDAFGVETFLAGDGTTVGDGIDTITDFDPNFDYLVVLDRGDTAFDPLDRLSEDARGTVFTYADDGSAIILQDVAIDALNEMNFQLSEPTPVLAPI